MSLGTTTVFTDVTPTFPYQSGEAREHLGIPDSPEVHLAITSLAERLLLITEQAFCEIPIKRITALRTASGAVLMSLPFECVELKLRVVLNLPADHDVADESYRTRRTDWLGQAVERLRSEGILVNPDFRKQASPYGWCRLP